MQPHVLSAIGARTQSFSFSWEILVSCTHPSSLSVSKSAGRGEIVKFYLICVFFDTAIVYGKARICFMLYFSIQSLLLLSIHFSDFFHHQRKQQKPYCFFSSFLRTSFHLSSSCGIFPPIFKHQLHACWQTQRITQYIIFQTSSVLLKMPKPKEIKEKVQLWKIKFHLHI